MRGPQRLPGRSALSLVFGCLILFLYTIASPSSSSTPAGPGSNLCLACLLESNGCATGMTIGACQCSSSCDETGCTCTQCGSSMTHQCRRPCPESPSGATRSSAEPANLALWWSEPAATELTAQVGSYAPAAALFLKMETKRIRLKKGPMFACPSEPGALSGNFRLARYPGQTFQWSLTVTGEGDSCNTWVYEITNPAPVAPDGVGATSVELGVRGGIVSWTLLRGSERLGSGQVTLPLASDIPEQATTGTTR